MILDDDDFKIIIPDINVPGPAQWSCVMSVFGHHFIMVLEKRVKCYGHQHFFATVQMIGTREKVRNFIYKLEIRGQGRRVKWQARPRSIREGVSSAITNSDCLVFAAQHFEEKGKLRIEVPIFRLVLAHLEADDY
jgi:hypothetical protein